MHSHTTCVVFKSDLIFVVEDLGVSKDLGVPSDDKCPLEDKSPLGVAVPNGAPTFDFGGYPHRKCCGLDCHVHSIYFFFCREREKESKNEKERVCA